MSTRIRPLSQPGDGELTSAASAHAYSCLDGHSGDMEMPLPSRYADRFPVPAEAARDAELALQAELRQAREAAERGRAQGACAELPGSSDEQATGLGPLIIYVVVNLAQP
jgi:hypothetical protein